MSKPRSPATLSSRLPIRLREGRAGHEERRDTTADDEHELIGGPHDAAIEERGDAQADETIRLGRVRRIEPPRDAQHAPRRQPARETPARPPACTGRFRTA